MNNNSLFLHPLLSILSQSGKMRCAFGLIALGIITLLAIGSPAAHAQGQGYNENTLASFGSSAADSISPNGDLIEVNGMFYGTAGGGTNNLGTVFAFNPTTHTEKVLYSFTSANGGPPSALLYDSTTNKLYGTTVYGGNEGNDGYDGGTIFSINLNGTGYQTRYSFKGIAPNATVGDGAFPEASLIEVNGIIYGTTESGGTAVQQAGYGTIFSFDPSTNAEKVLYRFTGYMTHGDGDGPAGPLLELGGKLYGTTSRGGGHDRGSVFSFDLSTFTEKVLYSFAGDIYSYYYRDGQYPGYGVTNANGILYGTAGGGTNNAGIIFSVNPQTNAEKTLYNFIGQYPTQSSAGNSEAIGSQGRLVYDSTTGKLFGVAGGGSYPTQQSTGYGTIFSFDPKSDTENTFYRFPAYSTDGQGPGGGFLDINGTLYGSTGAGGAYGSDLGSGYYNDGTIYSLTPVTLTIPTAVNDSYAPKYATAYAVKAPGVLGNDNAGGSNRPTATLVSNVSHGTLTFNHDGSFSYTPSTGFVGTDTFTYQASNPLYQSNTATVSLVVQAVVPVAHNDAYVPTYGHAYKVNAPGVLANDYTGDTGSLTAKLVSSVSHGTLAFNSDGSFLYTPTFGFSGTDSFTYQAKNPIGTSNTATVTFTIHPVVPIAHNDTYAPKYATAYGVSAPGVLGNDDTGGTTPMTAALVANVAHGTLTFNSNGSFTYTPAAGFVGADSFTYKDTTPTGTGNTATVTLNVTAAVPVAHNDAYTVAHNKAFAVKAPGVLANDYAGDTGTLTARLVMTTSHGILTFNSDGSFNYTPATGYSGTDTFTDQAKNAIGTSNTATVTLTVQ